MAKQRFRDIKQGRALKQRKNEIAKRDNAASRSKRLKAATTDTFMLAMPIMYIVFYFIFDGRKGFEIHMLLGWIYILLPLIIIQIIFMLRSKYGQTPGMKAYDLALVDLSTGEKPIAGVIVYRQMLSIFSIFTFGWISMFFRKDRRVLHEILSGTALIYSPLSENNSTEL